MNNQEIEQLLKKTIQRNTLLHSYMFIGSRFTQKEELAMQFAKEILCLNKEKAPCEECKSCVEIKNGNHPDFIEIQLEDDDSTIKIEQIRKLQNDVIKKPIISERKVYIIKDSDKMTIRSTKLLIKNSRRTTTIYNYNFISRK